MQDKRIIFKNPDGSCGIVVPSPNTKLTIEQIATKDVPAGLEHRITDTINVPTDRTFRNAWTDNNPTSTVDVDMPKARIIHMDNIRILRKPKLKELDTEFLKALEINDTTAQASIAAQKQALRDLPTTYDLSVYTTPEDLKKAIPSEVL